jgi:hypothetical protein
MIQAKDLRIGNDCLGDGKIVTIQEISSEGVMANLPNSGDKYLKYNQLQPIPLTSNIFKKCGFEEDGLYRYKKINFTMIEWDEGIYFLNGNSDFRIKYLHQLQNLYSFTGQELIYTP